MTPPWPQRLGLIGLLGLTACTSVAPPPVVRPPPPPKAAPAPPPAPVVIIQPAPPPEPDPTDAAGRELLRWQDALRQTPPEALPALAYRLAAEPATPAGVVHLALVWMNTRVPGDAARALPLLDNLQQSTDAAAQPWLEWARLLTTRATEQKRLEEQLGRQNQQLRDSQRRIDQLNEQLEALKAIERSLAPRSGRKTP